MIHIIRYLKPAISAILVFLAFETAVFFLHSKNQTAAISGIFILTGFLILSYLGIRNLKVLIVKSILPFFLIGGVVLFIIFVTSPLVQQLIVFFASVLLYFVFNNLPSSPSETKSNIRLVNIAVFFSFFLLLLGLFYLMLAFFISFWLTWLLMILISFCLMFYLFWHQNISENLRIFILFLLTIMLAEIFLITNFLPVNPFTKSAFLLVCFYTLYGLVSNDLNTAGRKKISDYLIVAFLLFVIIAAASHWSPLGAK